MVLFCHRRSTPSDKTRDQFLTKRLREPSVAAGCIGARAADMASGKIPRRSAACINRLQSCIRP
jgi:hypothetical protein